MPKVLFTRDTAGEMARRANAVIRSKKAMLREAPIPYSPETAPRPLDKFTAKQLSRVRKQIELLNDKLESAESAQDIDRLASAIARLSERERQLANRPLPGSYKPIAARPKRSYQHGPAPDVETRQSVDPTTNSVPPNAS